MRAGPAAVFIFGACAGFLYWETLRGAVVGLAWASGFIMFCVLSSAVREAQQ